MVSTKGRYAIRVMIDLAEHDTGNYVPLKDIAERQDISKKYLEIIVKDMVNGGLVTGASGKGGGYKLTRSLLSPVSPIRQIHVRERPPVRRFRCGKNMTRWCTTSSTARSFQIWSDKI